MTPWTVALQAPLSMGLSRQEYWSGLQLPSSGDLPDQRIMRFSCNCRQSLYRLSHQLFLNYFFNFNYVFICDSFIFGIYWENCHVFVHFWNFFWVLIFIVILFWPETIHHMIWVVLNLLRLFYSLVTAYFRKRYVHLSRLRMLPILNGVFCRYLFNLVSL